MVDEEGVLVAGGGVVDLAFRLRFAHCLASHRCITRLECEGDWLRVTIYAPVIADQEHSFAKSAVAIISSRARPTFPWNACFAIRHRDSSRGG